MNNPNYTKSFTGKITLMYAGMKRRSAKKNMELINCKEFRNIAKNSEEYKRLHEEWVKKDYRIKFSPSVDRRDNSKGYSKDNIQFLTHSANVSKGNKETRTGVTHVGTNMKAVTLTKNGQVLTFESGAAACKYLGVNRTYFKHAMNGNRTLQGWTCNYL